MPQDPETGYDIQNRGTGEFTGDVPAGYGNYDPMVPLGASTPSQQKPKGRIDVQGLAADPQFKALSPHLKRVTFRKLLGNDPDFQSLDPQRQNVVSNRVLNQFPDDVTPDALRMHPKAVEQFLGIKYKFGGEGKEGIDCSAFTQQLMARNGVKGLPRTAQEQWSQNRGQQITDPSQVKAGDLIFWQGGTRVPKGNATHVAYFAGYDTLPNGQKRPMVYAASSTAGAVVKQPLKGDLSLGKLQFLGARRYPEFQKGEPKTPIQQAARIPSPPKPGQRVLPLSPSAPVAGQDLLPAQPRHVSVQTETPTVGPPYATMRGLRQSDVQDFDIGQKAVDQFTKDWLRGRGPEANIPAQMADTLSKDPNNKQALARLSKMHNVTQIAVLEEAARRRQIMTGYDPDDPTGYAKALGEVEGGVKGFIRTNLAAGVEPQNIGFMMMFGPAEKAAQGVAFQVGKRIAGRAAGVAAARMVPRVAAGGAGLLGGAVFAPQAKKAIEEGDIPRAAAALLASAASVGLGAMGAMKGGAKPARPSRPTVVEEGVKPSATVQGKQVEGAATPYVRPRKGREVGEGRGVGEGAGVQRQEPAAARQGEVRPQVPKPEEVTPAAPSPQGVYELPTSQVKADPERFQYKTATGESGITGELRGVNVYDPNLAGMQLWWRDPKDGQTYTVNGHNRLALAKKTGQPTVVGRYIDAPTAEAARAVGALANIAEGRGTPIDAGKFFRETGLKPEDVVQRGVSLRGKLASDGMALARLPEPLWRLVWNEEMPVSRGVVIGNTGLNSSQQMALYQMLQKMGAKGEKLSDAEVGELTKFITGAGETEKAAPTLFGMEHITETNALQKARLSAWLKGQLAKDARLFGAVSKQAAAETLGEVGNVIKVEESAQRAQAARTLGELFDRLAVSKGPVADALNDAAKRLAGGANEQAVRNYLKEAVTTALQNTLAGRETAGVAGVPAVSEPAGGAKPAYTADIFGGEPTETEAARPVVPPAPEAKTVPEEVPATTTQLDREIAAGKQVIEKELPADIPSIIRWGLSRAAERETVEVTSEKGFQAEWSGRFKDDRRVYADLKAAAGKGIGKFSKGIKTTEGVIDEYTYQQTLPDGTERHFTVTFGDKTSIRAFDVKPAEAKPAVPVSQFIREHPKLTSAPADVAEEAATRYGLPIEQIRNQVNAAYEERVKSAEAKAKPAPVPAPREAAAEAPKPTRTQRARAFTIRKEPTAPTRTEPEELAKIANIPVYGRGEDYHQALSSLAAKGIPVYERFEDVPNGDQLRYHGTYLKNIPTILEGEVKGLLSTQEDASSRRFADVVLAMPVEGKDVPTAVADTDLVKVGKPVAAILNSPYDADLAYQKRAFARQPAEPAKPPVKLEEGETYVGPAGEGMHVIRGPSGMEREVSETKPAETRTAISANLAMTPEEVALRRVARGSKNEADIALHEKAIGTFREGETQGQARTRVIAELARKRWKSLPMLTDADRALIDRIPDEDFAAATEGTIELLEKQVPADRRAIEKEYGLSQYTPYPQIMEKAATNGTHVRFGPTADSDAVIHELAHLLETWVGGEYKVLSRMERREGGFDRPVAGSGREAILRVIGEPKPATPPPAAPSTQEVVVGKPRFEKRQYGGTASVDVGTNHRVWAAGVGSPAEGFKAPSATDPVWGVERRKIDGKTGATITEQVAPRNMTRKDAIEFAKQQEQPPAAPTRPAETPEVTPKLPISDIHELTLKQYQERVRGEIKAEYPRATAEELHDTYLLRETENAYYQAVVRAMEQGKQLKPRVLDALFEHLVGDRWQPNKTDAFTNLLSKYPQSAPEGYLPPPVRKLNAAHEAEMVQARREGKEAARRIPPEAPPTARETPEQVVDRLNLESVTSGKRRTEVIAQAQAITAKLEAGKTPTPADAPGLPRSEYSALVKALRDQPKPETEPVSATPEPEAEQEVPRGTPTPDPNKPVADMTWEEAHLANKQAEWQRLQAQKRMQGKRKPPSREAGFVTLEPAKELIDFVAEANRKGKVTVDFTKNHPKIARVFDRLRNAFRASAGAAFLNRTAPNTHDSLVAFDAANRLVDVNLRDTVSPLFKEMNPVERMRFTGMVLADRVVARRNSLMDAFNAETDPAKQEAIQADIDKLEFWYRDEQGNPIDLDQMVTDYFSDPKIAALRDAFDKGVTPLQEAYRTEAGYPDMPGKGFYSGLYVPGIVVGEPTAMGGYGRPLTRKLMTLAEVPGTERFMGTGRGYVLDPVEAVGLRLRGVARAAFMRTLFRNAFAEGILRDPVQPYAAFKGEGGTPAILYRDTLNGDYYLMGKKGYKRLEPGEGSGILIENRDAGTLALNPDFQMFDGTIPVRGTPENASIVSVKDWGVDRDEMLRLGLPDRAIMPNRAVSEMRPAFERALSDRAPWDSVVSQAISYYLTGTGEAAAHGMTLAGRLQTQIPKGGGPIVGALRQIPNLFPRRTFTPEVREAAQRVAAKAGVNRDFMTFNIRVPGERSPANFFGRLLYAERGAFNNAIAAVYTFGKQAGMQDAEIGRMMQALNTHSRVLSSGMERVLNPIGLGTFYKTGSTSRFVGFERGLVPKIMLQSFLTTTAISMLFDPEHKPYWMRAGRKSGDITVGHDDQGREVVWNIMGINRPQQYAEDLLNRVVSGVTAGENAKEILGDVVAGGLNIVATPAMTGPVGSVASVQSGHALGYSVRQPHSVFPFPMELKSAKAPPSEKALESLRALLPTTRMVLGEEPSKNAPAGEKWVWVNRILSALGQRPVKAVRSDAELRAMIISLRKRAEKEEERYGKPPASKTSVRPTYKSPVGSGIE